ncbi:MAG: hypothetical protein DHS20C14_14570 [Phycisphaeraceae bacterium]|nr:MAG: hypothetical protein DHS20C14_14570 [Phycisphaeraceae bacterium]
MNTMTNTADTGRSSMSDLKTDAAAVREDLATLKNDAVDVGTQAAQQVAERVKVGAEHASELAQTAGQQCKAAHESMCKQVTKHPTAAVLLALGAGAVIGRVMWR